MSATPFVTTTTPTIERAAQLLSLRQHPGFLHLIRISQQLVDQTTATLVDFGGWDPQQITVLKARAQAAKEHHVAWLAQIQAAIEAGEAEASMMLSESQLSPKSTAEICEQSDVLRMKVLQRIDEFETRVPGSY